jgi:polyphosphate glucokinase
MVTSPRHGGRREAVKAQAAIGVDVGGSGIKAALVDVTTGRLLGQRIRIATPNPATPDAVVRSIARLVRRVAKAPGAASAPVGVTVPAVVIDGVTRSASNIDPAWIGYPARDTLGAALERTIVVLNDADAAGIAEMRFGAGAGRPGTVLVLTLGTGVGSALFHDGHLVPNTELGQMEIRGRAAERRSASAARTRRGLSWRAWAVDLDEHLHLIDTLFSPNLVILGGGVSKRADKFLSRLTARPQIVPAGLLNDAGIVGAAMAAAAAAAADAADEVHVPTTEISTDGMAGEAGEAGEVAATNR